MLSDAEYGEVIRNRGLLQSKIDTCEAGEAEYKRLADIEKATKKRAEDALKLYINFLADAIKEYEEAHPVEEPI